LFKNLLIWDLLKILYGFKNGLVEKSNDAKIRIHSKVQC
jgi:hypothetical protein